MVNDNMKTYYRPSMVPLDEFYRQLERARRKVMKRDVNSTFDVAKRDRLLDLLDSYMESNYYYDVEIDIVFFAMAALGEAYDWLAESLTYSDPYKRAKAEAQAAAWRTLARGFSQIAEFGEMFVGGVGFGDL